tara:strand:+ start:600 stop:962 length:363 start_codon:yes stop_codon:yes gene_type:complete
MKKLILLLLFIPLVSFGQDDKKERWSCAYIYKDTTRLTIFERENDEFFSILMKGYEKRLLKIMEENDNEIHFYEYQPISGLSAVFILNKRTQQQFGASIGFGRVPSYPGIVKECLCENVK